jgi:hypothetical protein
MVFWCSQDQFQQDSRPLFSCFERHTFAAKEVPKDTQFENRSLGTELCVFWCKGSCALTERPITNMLHLVELSVSHEREGNGTRETDPSSRGPSSAQLCVMLRTHSPSQALWQKFVNLSRGRLSEPSDKRRDVMVHEPACGRFGLSPLACCGC